MTTMNRRTMLYSCFFSLLAICASVAPPLLGQQEIVSGPVPPPAQALPEVVARVGDWTVTRDMLWPRIRMKVERMSASRGSVPPSFMRYLGRPILKQMIDEYLLLPEAVAAGFLPEWDRARSHIQSMRKNLGQREALERFLGESGLIIEEYTRELSTRSATRCRQVGSAIVQPEAIGASVCTVTAGVRKVLRRWHCQGERNRTQLPQHPRNNREHPAIAVSTPARAPQLQVRRQRSRGKGRGRETDFHACHRSPVVPRSQPSSWISS